MWLGLKLSGAKPGDEVIVTDPMFGSFYQQVDAAKLKRSYWNIDVDDGYRFYEEELKKLISPRTKLLYLCNPHNPTGRVMTREELKAIADIAVDRKLRVMVDELWEDIVYDGRKHVTLASLNPEIEKLTTTTWGISKTWGIPGVQLGYTATTNRKIMEEIIRVASPFYHGASTLGQAAARAVLDPSSEYWIRGIMKQLYKMREIATKRLREMGCTVPELQGTYLMFLKFNVDLNHNDIYRFMIEKAKVGLQSGTDFGPKGRMHLRMTIATSEVILNEALNRIESAFKNELT
jgi:aspartate/methionine/tyrosine aminotransferase